MGAGDSALGDRQFSIKAGPAPSLKQLCPQGPSRPQGAQVPRACQLQQQTFNLTVLEFRVQNQGAGEATCFPRLQGRTLPPQPLPAQASGRVARLCPPGPTVCPLPLHLSLSASLSGGHWPLIQGLPQEPWAITPETLTLIPCKAPSK